MVSAAQLFDSPTVDSNVAPIVLLHGVDSGCGSTGSWIDMIKEAVGDDTVVKCVEIGGGKTASKFIRM